MKVRLAAILFVMAAGLSAQNTFNFDGQLSGIANYSPEAVAWGLLNGLYIPELNYDWKLDTNQRSLYFEASANIWGSGYFYSDSTRWEGNIEAYRVFARYTGNQVEFRQGLQKIDFGSAMILRPLQWFNEIDPRDPLAITNGVWAGLGRYYFLNNANIWVWGMLPSTNPRGLDLTKSASNQIEFGGRFQQPTNRGEIAITYHHRKANPSDFSDFVNVNSVPENRFGLDGKWDLGIGLWFETSYVRKQEDLGLLTNQTLGTIGADYTFGIGHGLNVVLEHMISGYDEKTLGFEKQFNTTAINFSYPLGFFDNLSIFSTYSWEVEAASFFVNYQHDFRKVTGYFMAYYTPETNVTLIESENDFVSSFAGPGLRIMLLFKH